MLYSALWRALPGRPAVKALQALVLVVLVVAVLFLWVFPRIAPLMPFNDNTVDAGPAGARPPPSPQGPGHDRHRAPGSAPPRILVVDNYDSFVFTIVGYLRRSAPSATWSATTPSRPPGARTTTACSSPPGRGRPEAGVSMAMIEACAERAQPMLGVCLGHQALGAVCGASVVRAPELLHGKTSLVSHDGTGVLAGLASPFTATRYHSLTIDPPTMPESLLANGQTESGVIMAVRHASLPLHGVQFHPESVLTEGGHRILANWLAMCGMPGAVEHADGLSPLVRDVEGVARMVSAG